MRKKRKLASNKRTENKSADWAKTIRLSQKMFEAVGNGNYRFLRQLISEGGDVNARDLAGDATLLHLAASLSAYQCLAVLVRSRRCNFLVRDKDGYLPSEVSFIFANDPKAGAFLARLEAQQIVAEEQRSGAL